MGPRVDFPLIGNTRGNTLLEKVMRFLSFKCRMRRRERERSYRHFYGANEGGIEIYLPLPSPLRNKFMFPLSKYDCAIMDIPYLCSAVATQQKRAIIYLPQLGILFSFLINQKGAVEYDSGDYNGRAGWIECV